jgi:hypothetical protein
LKVYEESTAYKIQNTCDLGLIGLQLNLWVKIAAELALGNSFSRVCICDIGMEPAAESQSPVGDLDQGITALAT